MSLNKRMRTVVISGKKIKKISSCIYALLGVGLMGVIIATAAKIPGLSGNTGIKIISENMNFNRYSLKETIVAALGFDPNDEKTIFYGYYSLFGAVDVAEAAESAPPELKTDEETTVAETQSVPEQKVEEIKISKGMEVSDLAGMGVDANALANEDLHIRIDKSGPQVLIIHTHTTESFADSSAGTGSDRNTDSEKNMVAVGETIKNVLEEEGIETIHDTTVHDYPSYNGAYTRSKATANKNLEKYQSIKVVLDVHRDGIVREDGTKVKVLSEINGERAAQCMFVIGSNAQLAHDNWKDNMRFACILQKYANENYPGLMRPIILRKERFNQQISSGAIIIEVGSNGNTLEEAKNGAKYMAKTISAVLRKK